MFQGLFIALAWSAAFWGLLVYDMQLAGIYFVGTLIISVLVFGIADSGRKLAEARQTSNRLSFGNASSKNNYKLLLYFSRRNRIQTRDEAELLRTISRIRQDETISRPEKLHRIKLLRTNWELALKASQN